MSIFFGHSPALAPCLVTLGLGPLARGQLPASAELEWARGLPVLRELQLAVAGLVYTSDSDFPLVAFAWPSRHGPPTREGVVRICGWPPGSPAVERTVVDFFATAATPQPWQSPGERATARRFQTLVHVLETRLHGARVFLFGTIEIDACIVGVTSSGDWAGVITHLVQT
jgi:hypothetical protein